MFDINLFEFFFGFISRVTAWSPEIIVGIRKVAASIWIRPKKGRFCEPVGMRPWGLVGFWPWKPLAGFMLHPYESDQKKSSWHINKSSLPKSCPFFYWKRHFCQQISLKFLTIADSLVYKLTLIFKEEGRLHKNMLSDGDSPPPWFNWGLININPTIHPI